MLPIDEVKIDKSFILHLNDSKDDKKMISTIISIAKNFDLNIVAEGVENLETAQQLKKMGCDFAQGYYYSKPVPASQVQELIKRINSSTLEAAG